MKKIFCFVITLLLLNSCAKEVKEVKRIPLTTNSEEARVLMQEFLLNMEEQRGFLNEELHDSILKLDPDFFYVKAYDNFGSSSERRESYISAFENKDKVSVLEAGIIESNYERRINGNLNKADEVIDSLISKFPDYYELYLRSGNLKNALRNSHGAQLRWEQATALNPNSFNAYFALSTLHYPTGIQFTMLPPEERDLDKAKEMLEKCAKILPKSFIPSRFLGNVYRAKGDFENALKEYKNSLDLNPDTEGNQYANSLLMVGHVYTFQGQYETARQYYQNAIEISNNWWKVQTTDILCNTYLYERKYDKAISRLSQLQEEIQKFDEEDIFKLNLTYFSEFAKFLAFGHSQNKEETLHSVETLHALNDAILEIRFQTALDEEEKQRIKINLSSENLKMAIWYNILFGDYEVAREQIADFEIITNQRMLFNSSAINDYKKMLGYLNLMEGNLEESIRSYEEVSAEVISDDNYHMYFYALAKKASGDLEGSKKIFIDLANDNFATWQNSIVKNLAKDQIKVNI